MIEATFYIVHETRDYGFHDVTAHPTYDAALTAAEQKWTYSIKFTAHRNDVERTDVTIGEVVVGAETLVDLIVALHNDRGYVKEVKTLWMNGQPVEE